MLNSFRNGDMVGLEKYASDNESIITDISIRFGDYGLSRNDKFNNFLSNFNEIAFQLYEVTLWLKKVGQKSSSNRYQISKCFEDVKLYFNIIKEQARYWQKSIKLTDKEYNEIDPKDIKRKEYKYEQTIPLNPNGLNATFDLNISLNDDNTVNINGTTNLFDNATLMISLRDIDNLLLAQSKSIVDNGIFEFGRFGKEGVGFKKGLLKVDIILAIPSVQNKEFVSKAGIGYENLKGKYVDRNGIGPVVRYTKEFRI